MADASTQQLHNEDVHDRAALVALLHAVTRWVTATEIRMHTGLTGKRVRQLCQIYPTLLVSSSEGYKLSRNATHSEKIKCVQSLIARGEKIISRASQLAGTL